MTTQSPPQHFGFLYVMYSRANDLSKFGYTSAPIARLGQTRKERRDDSIQLVAMWSVWDCGPFVDAIGVERMLHVCLRDLCAKHPTQTGLGEWYGTYWPNLVAYLESTAAMLSVLGICMRRGRLVTVS